MYQVTEAAFAAWAIKQQEPPKGTDSFVGLLVIWTLSGEVLVAGGALNGPGTAAVLCVVGEGAELWDSAVFTSVATAGEPAGAAAGAGTTGFAAFPSSTWTTFSPQ